MRKSFTLLLAACICQAAGAQITYSTGSSASFPAPIAVSRSLVADLDNDGDADILYQTGANGTAFQYARNNGNGTFTILAQASSPFAGLTLPDNSSNNYYAGDFDGDGDLDLWVSVANTTGSYFRNDGTTFSAQTSATFPAPASAVRCLVGDFDGDKDDDILYQTGGNGTAFQYARSNGNGTFTILSQAASPFAGLTLADHTGSNYSAGDVDGDGDLDIQVGGNGTTGNYYRNDGSGFSSQSTATFPVPAASSRMLVADFDSDGDADILYQTGNSGTPFQYARSNGDGTYTILSQAASPFAGLALPDHSGLNYFAGDFDGDGDVDVWAGVNAATGSFFVQNDRPPYIAASNPADNSTGFYRDANINLTFNEMVSKGSGNIYLVLTSTNTVVETIAVSSAKLTGSGTAWSLNPATTLAANTSYALRFDRKSFVDASGAIFFGISNNTTLNFSTGAVLPVQFISFTARPAGVQSVLLQWTTGTEINNSRFIIERSPDGNTWNTVGTVTATTANGAGASYRFTDASPVTGKNYYRLKQEDADGQVAYSTIQTVTISGRATVLKSNTVTDGSLQVSLYQPLTLVIYSVNGGKMYEQAAQAGSHTISVSGWAKGSYFLKAGEETLPFVIQ